MTRSGLHSFRSITGRISLIMLVSMYLLFSIGIIKSTHFCMGREASVAFFTTEAKKCACSLFAGEKDSCCDDEHELLRLENEQKVISTFSLSLPEWMVFEKLYTEQLIASLLPRHSYEYAVVDPSPPPVPLYKFHCSLVFYDDELIA